MWCWVNCHLLEGGYFFLPGISNHQIVSYKLSLKWSLSNLKKHLKFVNGVLRQQRNWGSERANYLFKTTQLVEEMEFIPRTFGKESAPLGSGSGRSWGLNSRFVIQSSLGGTNRPDPSDSSHPCSPKPLIWPWSCYLCEHGCFQLDFSLFYKPTHGQLSHSASFILL